MSEFILLGLIAVFFGGATMMAYLGLVRRRERVAERLKAPHTPSDPSIGSKPELVLGDLTPALSEQVPMSLETRSELQRELQSAGLYRPTALMEYTAVRAVLIIIPLILGGVIALLWTETVADGLKVFLGAVVAAMLGFSLPRLYLYIRAMARKSAIERGLPVAIDMLTLCLSAGLNVLNSIERVADELSMAYPELGFELQLVRRQADLRSLEFALVQFAERVDLPQLRNVSVILNQSEKLGTDGITVLREYADNMRVNMKQRAEAIANRAPLKMLIPAYLMGIGVFILILTPPAMELAAFRQENVVGDLKQNARQAIEEANRGLIGARNVGPAQPTEEEQQP
jgi:tight adherence protein C